MHIGESPKRTAHVAMSASGSSLAAEDTVEYRLYPVESEACDHGYLTRLAVECTHLARCIVGNHLWHYEPFRLGVWHGNEGVRGWVLLSGF